ncbi:MAG: hypothetical protein ABIU95_15810 [Burkholderiales bacterium]
MNRPSTNGGGRLVGASLALIALALTAGHYLSPQALAVGTGFVARTLCSGMFVSGRNDLRAA